MGKKIAIDPEIYERSKEYILKQLDVMETYGSRPVLTPDAFEDLIYWCAVYPQQLRNWQKKKEAKHARN